MVRYNNTTPIRIMLFLAIPVIAAVILNSLRSQNKVSVGFKSVRGAEYQSLLAVTCGSLATIASQHSVSDQDASLYREIPVAIAFALFYLFVMNWILRKYGIMKVATACLFLSSYAMVSINIHINKPVWQMIVTSVLIAVFLQTTRFLSHRNIPKQI